MMKIMFKKSVNDFKKVFLSVLVFSPVMVHAENIDDEVKELRAEILELKKIVQQQSFDSKKSIDTISTQSDKLQADTTQTQKLIPAPVFVTKSGSSVKLYGFIRGDASYQFKGGNGIFNRINKVELEGSNKNEDRFYSTVTTSRLGLDFKSEQKDQPVSGKLEIDFRGGSNNDTVRIRHAYLNYKNLLIGQTTSSFLDTDNNPAMLDFGSPLGIGTKRTPMLRYADNLNAQTKFFLGLEQGQTDNRLPSFTSKLKYSLLDDKGSASIRGLAQEVRSRELDNATEFSWGIGIGANYKITNDLEVNADYSHVKGDSTFLLYTNAAYNSEQNQNAINLNEFDAFSVGLSYQINPKLLGTIAYGAMFSDDSNKFAEIAKNDADTSQNKELQQAWINLMYSPIAPLTFGVEYIYGERETFTGEKGKDSRLSTMVKYNF
ncbi:DcaP family trimeric outer membrane transporter [Acinetobacter rongchengensis]|uniref:DcaP-like protein n=1 Tax=Acinetobacter rongchengensis TaxID=2419601 RepID=A0A3A8EXJ9_9GAMM|nr:DcaP family trimeric outer membrane transporter [Acinetobacter rongchengensis]RKG38166.1 DcaP-like protein [Acinetobacter rongchengensis]